MINSTSVTENGITFNQIESIEEYFFCAYDNSSVLVKDKVSGKVMSLSNLVGAETIEELQAWIDQNGLKDIEKEKIEE